MSLNAHGVIRIAEEPNENALDNGGAYFNCIAEGKDPKKKGGRFYYKLSIYVPANNLSEARVDLIKGCIIEVKHSTVDGIRTQKDINVIFNQVQTAWWNISVMLASPRS